jgi:hypothetical protein
LVGCFVDIGCTTDGYAIEVGEGLADRDCYNNNSDEEEAVNTSIDQKRQDAVMVEDIRDKAVDRCDAGLPSQLAT